MYICKYEILAHFNLVVAKVDRQIAKFNSPPNFPAILYIVLYTPTILGGGGGVW